MPPTDNAGAAEITNDLEANIFYMVITNTIALNSLVEKHNGAGGNCKGLPELFC